MGEELLPCPLCGSKPRLWIHSGFKARKSMVRTEYGYSCSLGSCPWSYACAMNATKEEAVKYWNQKVCEKDMLIEASKRLRPCKCGGQPEIVFDRYKEGGFWSIFCKDCHKVFGFCNSMDDLIEVWNVRGYDD